MSSWSTADKIVTVMGVLTVLFFLPLLYIPVLGYIIQTAAIFATMYLAFKRRFSIMIAGAAGSLILASFIWGFSGITLAFWAVSVIPSIALGWLLSAGASISRTFLIALGLSVVASMGLYWAEKELVYEITDQFLHWVDSGLPLDSITPAQARDIKEMFGALVDIVKRLLPSLIALSNVVQLFAGWIFLIVILRSMGEFAPTFRNFLYWKMPEVCVYLTGMFLLTRLVGTELMKVIADNVLLFVGFFYAVFGFSVLEYYLKKIRLSLFLRILFYIGILLLQLPGLILAAIIGFADSYFDFRKVKARIIG